MQAEIGGKIYDVVEVQMGDTSEKWSQIALDDGSVIKIKPVVLRVMRAIDGYDKEGNPLYQIKINQVITVSSPDNLRKGAEKGKIH